MHQMIPPAGASDYTTDAMRRAWSSFVRGRVQAAVKAPGMPSVRVVHAPNFEFRRGVHMDIVMVVAAQ